MIRFSQFARTGAISIGAVALLAATSVLTACGTTEADVAHDPASLVGKTYLSTSVSGTPIPGDGPLEVTFPQAGRIAATAGCNRHMGEVTFAGDTMTPGQLAATMMACPGARADADGWLSNLLGGPLSWSTSGTTLTLSRAGQTVKLTERANTALVGTEWTVRSIVHSQGIESSQVIEEIAPTLTITGGGKASGFAGCNQFTGDATVNGDKIEFRGIVTTQKACDDEVSRVEKNVLDTLRGAVTYEVEGKQLTLTNDADPSIGLRLQAP
ncbi:MAG: META domain-containing protein [Gordonia sp. (in: high G+C Gram-positive bacteria)]|uniref:META domain-containing protein n=1 Tax=Gordonia sp. (in: high G+C Gram-positive bacteria) TaxID=84139 RepID=UPI003BB6A0DE